EAGLAVFGPVAQAAAIEGSKAFAKRLMERHQIPTARFATFAAAPPARRYCRERGAPLVIKADGLAGGKGAIVCRTLPEADEAIGECLERKAFGAAGSTVVVEEFLAGEEVSFFALANGNDVLPLAAAEDHKTVFDGDRGPNTGGMGAHSPVASFDAAMERRVMETIVRPTIAALAKEGAPYRGVLYVGLMLTAEGPKVLEFNCRFGDPEGQAPLVRAPGAPVPPPVAAAHGAARAAAMGRRVMETIVRPTIAALAKEGAPYRGVLYVGLMLTAEGPKVLEFNCRFGDPECQALLVRAPGDLVPLLVAAAHGGSWPEVGGWPARASVCVALASRGYPGKYRTGVTIDGVEA